MDIQKFKILFLEPDIKEKQQYYIIKVLIKLTNHSTG